MAMRIMRGDSYPVPVEITMDGQTVTPDMVEEIEICVGSGIRKTLTAGEVAYQDGLWYIHLSQEETFSLAEESNVYVRSVYPGQTPVVIGAWAGRIAPQETESKEVL